MNTKNLFFFLAISCLSFNPVYAAEYSSQDLDQGNNFIITIQNTGSENCTLIEKNISQGKLPHFHAIPLLLEATGEAYEFIINGDEKRIMELTLKYKCGDHKNFSLYMKNFQKKNYKHRSTDVRFSGVDVFETHKITPGLQHFEVIAGAGWVGNASKISWVITH